MTQPIFWKNFEARTDLQSFGNNALLLYAFDLRFDIEDINFFASENIVENNDDKKCDLIYIDYESKSAIVTQSYFAKTIKKEAKANKASDLNTAAGWLLSSDITKVPLTIKDSAVELRSGIKGNLIDTIEFWFLHNCYESKNVKNELEIVSKTVSNALKTHYKENTTISVKSIEVGIETIEEWYKSSKATILISDKLTIDIPGGYLIKETDWEAFSTSIPLKWLYEISKKYKKPLFSANIRDYLGSRKSDANINNGIKDSAEKEPEMFWVYNNGITAIVNSFEPIYSKKQQKYTKLKIEGISIVNGAQTTGAIGSLLTAPKLNGLVAARFIKSNNQTTVKNVIRFNNSQNKISPSDFRSTDQYQDKLRKEFLSYKEKIYYTGGRRGGDEDKIKRPQNYLPFEKVTQSLAAFHQNPGLAYNYKTELWESDAYYAKIFNSETTAEHIIFVFALLKNISDYKLLLMSTTEIKTDDNDIFNQPKLNSGLNVLTILTFIGCGIQLLASLFGYFSAKTNYENKDEVLRKMSSGDMPSFAKKMIPDPAIYEKMVTQSYLNRFPIIIISLVSIALCFYGALQMRKLKKQGFTFYAVGEILPFFSTAFFLGSFSLSGVWFYISIAIALFFILMYAGQRKNMV